MYLFEQRRQCCERGDTGAVACVAVEHLLDLLQVAGDFAGNLRLQLQPADFLAEILAQTFGHGAGGLALDGIEQPPVGLEDVSKFHSLTRALLEKGYSPADIRKIYGGNTLRLMRAVEAAARRLTEIR